MAGIRHIEFWVANLENSLDFYKILFAALGWEQIDANGFVSGETKIYLIEQPVTSDQKVPGPRHICFQATSHEMVDKIAQLPCLVGRILHGPAVLHPNGSYMLVCKDPDGYIIEVAN